MLSKRLIISIFSVLFFVVIVISAVFAFSVSKFNTEYNVIGDTDAKTETLNSKLAAFMGKNLLFLDTDDVKNALNADPYFECVSVSKSFPNIVNVTVKERREVYLVSYDGERFVTDEKGFVLRKFTGEKTRELVGLTIDNFGLNKPVVGTYLMTEHNERLKTAFEISDRAGLSDRINEMRVVKNYGGNLTSYDIEFLTYTGVLIKITKFDDDGEEKAEFAFAAYDAADDYKKSFYTIKTLKRDDGEIVNEWTRKNT